MALRDTRTAPAFGEMHGFIIPHRVREHIRNFRLSISQIQQYYLMTSDLKLKRVWSRRDLIKNPENSGRVYILDPGEERLWSRFQCKQIKRLELFSG